MAISVYVKLPELKQQGCFKSRFQFLGRAVWEAGMMHTHAMPFSCRDSDQFFVLMRKSINHTRFKMKRGGKNHSLFYFLLNPFLDKILQCYFSFSNNYVGRSPVIFPIGPELMHRYLQQSFKKTTIGSMPLILASGNILLTW